MYETHCLQGLTWSWISTGSLYFSPHTVRQEGHITAGGEEGMGGAGLVGGGRSRVSGDERGRS